MNDKSSFETFLKWAVVVILAVAALKILATVLGLAWLLGGFLLFRVLPLILLVWGFMKLIEWWKRDRNAHTGTTF
jgi:hypothetical protein